MVVPDITNVFFAGLIHGIEEQAAESGYDLLLVSSGEDEATERRRIEALIDRQIDGLLVVPATDGSILPLRDSGRASFMPPTVLLDRGFGAPGFDSVGAECEAGRLCRDAASDRTRPSRYLGIGPFPSSGQYKGAHRTAIAARWRRLRSDRARASASPAMSWIRCAAPSSRTFIAPTVRRRFSL